MERRQEGRIALVTGGSKGIGRAVAERLAREGATVIVCARDGGAAEAAAVEIAALGSPAVGMSGDVGDEDSVARLFRMVEERFGLLHILVNNAGISPKIQGHKGSIEQVPLKIWTETLRTNLTGMFLVSRAAAPLLKKAGWGRIVSVTSQAGRMYTGFGSVHYSASKAGQIGLSRVLAGELGPFGITVNCVSPSRTASAMAQTFADAGKVEGQYIARTPVGRVGTPEDVAAAIAFLASDEAGYINGTIVDVTGGFFMP
jgi:3-oxoacyl-[acyl-carrier protein] reductase